ncbi:hypothetical protein BaRGS_00023047 [Batillaria attramentaria]|uniref:Secreted protein n=1 Tax=Batillaria attramentaria TaxID=370345 RepID=A0ABD0KF43_9CAEN
MLFVLFLVSGLLTAQGQGNPFRRQSDSEDWCASGSSVLKKFLTCGQETIDALQLFEVEVLNYEALLSILNVYCRQVNHGCGSGFEGFLLSFTHPLFCLSCVCQSLWRAVTRAICLSVSVCVAGCNTGILSDPFRNTPS